MSNSPPGSELAELGGDGTNKGRSPFCLFTGGGTRTGQCGAENEGKPLLGFGVLISNKFTNLHEIHTIYYL